MILFALVAAVTVVASATTPAPNAGGAAAPADGVYNYSIAKDGNVIGKSSVTVKRTDVGLTLHETETLDGPLGYVIDQILDLTTLAPKAYVGSFTAGNEPPTVVRAALDRGGAVVTFDGVPGTAQLANPRGVSNAYVLEGSLMSGFLALPAQLHASRASQFSQVMPRSVLQFLCRVDPHPNALRPTSVPAGDSLLMVSGSGVPFEEWYDPSSFTVHAMSVPSQQVTATLTK